MVDTVAELPDWVLWGAAIGIGVIVAPVVAPIMVGGGAAGGGVVVGGGGATTGGSVGGMIPVLGAF